MSLIVEGTRFLWAVEMANATALPLIISCAWHGIFICCIYTASSDSSAGRILWVEVLDSTGTRNPDNVESALFQCGGSSKTGASNSQNGDGKTASGDGNFIETIALPVSVL